MKFLLMIVNQCEHHDYVQSNQTNRFLTRSLIATGKTWPDYADKEVMLKYSDH